MQLKLINYIWAARLGPLFHQATETILAHPGNTIVCGIGKPGAIAQKLTATLCSTGTRGSFPACRRSSTR